MLRHRLAQTWTSRLHPRAGREIRIGPGLAACAAAALVLAGAVWSDTTTGTNQTLQLMGFDPDRAQLITALLVGSVAAAAATLVTGRRALEAFLGLAVGSVLFYGTFLAETDSALASHGAAGSFDPGGWSLTVATLLLSGLVSGWAGSALAADLRPAIVAALADIRDTAARRRLEGPAVRRMGSIALVAVMLVVGVPAFGDIVNFSPDTLMLHGGPALVGLTGPGETPAPAATASPDLTADPSPNASASATPMPFGSPNRPWLTWATSGSGRLTGFSLPAPWTGGVSTTAQLEVYTPPGYSPNSGHSYPVIYEVPWGSSAWTLGANIQTELNALIDDGTMPPTIVVFVDAAGGPHADSECANSADGREWFDTYVRRTVVGWVDSRYRTIATPAGRAVMGMSQGGYCAAVLALRHPDVFGTAISFSGYFQAGLFGVTATSIFAGNPALLAAASPLTIAPQLPAAVRTSLAFILVSEPGQPLYGTQATQFARVLQESGYPLVAINASVGHGWTEVRQMLPGVLRDWASRLARLNLL
jgi:hypothetical protein